MGKGDTNKSNKEVKKPKKEKAKPPVIAGGGNRAPLGGTDKKAK